MPLSSRRSAAGGRVRDPHRPGRGGARAPLEGPQVGLRGDGPRRHRLLRPGRRRPAHEAARGAAADRRARARARPPRRQRLPCGRRQPASARALRRRRRRGRARPRARRGDPRRLPRRRRLADRRARHRRRQGVLDADRCSRSATWRCSGGCGARSTPTGSQTRARCCRRRGSAARCPARTARTRSRGPGLPSVSSLGEAAAILAEAADEGRRLRHRPRPRRPRISTGSSSTSRAT